MSRRGIRYSIAGLALAVALLVSVAPLSAAPPATGSRKIVVFRSGSPDEAALRRIERLGGQRVKDLPLVGATVVRLPDAAAERAVEALPAVERVEDDVVVRSLAKPRPSQPAQVVSWGVDRIEADVAWPAGTGDAVKVAVLDTGIDTSHPDLVANIAGGFDAIGRRGGYRDDNGHGTHVAGIVAAASNDIGVVGVASGADLYAVKVLDRKGSGYLSDIIEGLEWAIGNDMDVANMSLGTPSYSATFAQAVQAAYDAGIVLVAAAGNDGPGADTVEYPARFPQVIAVSATTASDAVASFSSTGPSVELAAPGSSVYSTYKGSAYKTLSGTSMASPHVAGSAALVIGTAPSATYDTDADGAWDPAEVRTKLRATAEDLGAAGPDPSFGYGLVRADSAIAP